jgi:membrane protease YdiL (CAAX protease family)
MGAARAERRVGVFLDELRTALRRHVPNGKADEIVAELRSHIRDVAERGGELDEQAVEGTLIGLGTPSALAAQYAGETTTVATIRLPDIGAGLGGLLGAALCATLGLAFAVAGLLKPFLPDRAGLWQTGPDTYSLRLGLGGRPAPGEDILGGWIVPIGLALGIPLAMAAAGLATSSLRRFRLEVTPIVWCELLIIGALFVGDAHGLVVFSKTPFLLVLAWASLRWRGLGWRNVGMSAPTSWGRTLALGALAGTAIQSIEQWCLVPLVQALTGAPPDVESFRVLVGNPGVLVAALALSWTLAAVGEEAFYRGFFMTRVAELAGGRRAAWVWALVLVSAVFGVAHLDQGPAGWIENAISGLMLGVLYLAAGRNLWMPIVAHGVSNTIDLVMMFFGRYPGL